MDNGKNYSLMSLFSEDDVLCASVSSGSLFDLGGVDGREHMESPGGARVPGTPSSFSVGSVSPSPEKFSSPGRSLRTLPLPGLVGKNVFASPGRPSKRLASARNLLNEALLESDDDMPTTKRQRVCAPATLFDSSLQCKEGPLMYGRSSATGAQITNEAAPLGSLTEWLEAAGDIIPRTPPRRLSNAARSRMRKVVVSGRPIGPPKAAGPSPLVGPGQGTHCVPKARTKVAEGNAVVPSVPTSPDAAASKEGTYKSAFFKSPSKLTTSVQLGGSQGNASKLFTDLNSSLSTPPPKSEKKRGKGDKSKPTKASQKKASKAAKAAAAVVDGVQQSPSFVTHTETVSIGGAGRFTVRVHEKVQRESLIPASYSPAVAECNRVTKDRPNPPST